MVVKLQIRGIQPADYAATDELAKDNAGAKKRIGQHMARLRRSSNYEPILEIVSEEDGQISGTASLHEITVSGTVGLAMGPIFETKSRLISLISELEARARQAGFRFIVWHPLSKIDPRSFGFENADDYEIFLPGPHNTMHLYVYSLVKNGLRGVHGKIDPRII